MGSHLADPSHIDGFYVLGDGRDLTIDYGVFRLNERSTSLRDPVCISGPVSISAGRLIFRLPSESIECPFVVRDGRLLLGTMAQNAPGEFKSAPCDQRFHGARRRFPNEKDPVVMFSTRQGRWWFGSGTTTTLEVAADLDAGVLQRFHPDLDLSHGDRDRLNHWYERFGDSLLTPWVSDLGPVGVRPIEGMSAIGIWLGEKGTRIDLIEPKPREPEPPPFFGRDEEGKPDEWSPDRFGVSHAGSKRLPHPPMSHFDSEAHTYWVLTTRTEAVRFRTGGCHDLEPSVERFTRVEAPQRPRN